MGEWQTRSAKDAVPERECEFKSRPRHNMSLRRNRNNEVVTKVWYVILKETFSGEIVDCGYLDKEFAKSELKVFKAHPDAKRVWLERQTVQTTTLWSKLDDEGNEIVSN